MSWPSFSMSEYASQTDLYKDKAAYYEALAKFLAANVDNEELTDAEFRQVARKSLPTE